MIRRALLVQGLAVILMSVLFLSFKTEAKSLVPLEPEEMYARLIELQHLPWNGATDEWDIREEGRCRISNVSLEVRDPLGRQSRWIEIVQWRPRAAKAPVPAILVVPVIEGQTMLERQVAEDLCDEGFAALLTDVNDNSQPPSMPAWGHEDYVSRFSILALRTVLDYAEQKPEFDRQRLGAFGMSLGAITTAMLAGIERDRLKAVVTALGGVNLPSILSKSTNARVAILRQRRLRYMHSESLDEYESALQSTIKYDPFYFAPLVHRDRMMMVLAEDDEKVPYANQQEQAAAFGNPKTITYPGSHVETLIRFVYLNMGAAFDFFNEQFGKNSLYSQRAEVVGR